MQQPKRIRDYGIRIGEMPCGANNTITDVPGVRVGHSTIHTDTVKTGVTAVIPHDGNLFCEKVPAACHVINGFGKSTGLMQIQELGTMETPILLTNTFSVGTATDALIRYKLDRTSAIGTETGTVNPVVCECNDGFLNDIRGQHVKACHVNEAILTADKDFLLGAVGGGTGMSCYRLKGGIGSASRRVETTGTSFTLGVLAQCNMGQKRDLLINGHPVGAAIAAMDPEDQDTPQEKGSIIMVLATDAPVSDRQLQRIARRCLVGLNRTGSFIGSGSGEIVIAFSTAYRIRHWETADTISIPLLNENRIDAFFRAAAEATEEAILDAMVTADPATGRNGHHRRSLREFASLFPKS